MTLTIDGSYGEGGGQILRSALTLSVITGKAVHLVNIRAGRRKPGLRPQHRTAVQAATRICGATVMGDHLDSQTLTFIPQAPAQPGNYVFDVADAAQGGSAGAVTLILQTILLPLALASGTSHIVLKGGTHVSWSPSALYVERVYLSTLARMGVHTQFTIQKWGFYPRGGGEISVEIKGNANLRPLSLTERGELDTLEGIAYVANLPSRIPQRMSDRARSVLRNQNITIQLAPRHVPSTGPGAGFFLLAHYAEALAGFTSLGRKGLRSEIVAETAVEAFLAHHHSQQAVDPFLADQLLLPLALSGGSARVTTSRITRHLLTNLWVARKFELAPMRVEGVEGEPGSFIIEEQQ